jgi:hypothetical protein
MHVSVRRYRDVPDLAGFIRDVEIEFVPRLKSMPGFVAYYAVDEGNGSLTTVSVFSSADMAEESNAAAADWIRECRPDAVLIPAEVASGRLSVVHPPIRG